MSQLLRMLLLEDNPADAELLIRALKKSDFEVIYDRVDSEMDLIAHLDMNPALDVIVSDYHMPSFTGSRALEIVRGRGLDVPFILISGTVGEDIAVEAMRQGASDYLMKDRLKRLGEAIHHAMEERRVRKHSEEEIKRTNDRFRAFFELDLIGMAITSSEKGILAVNEKLCLILGYTAAELVQMQWPPITHPDDLAMDVAHFDRVMRGESDAYSIEKRFVRKDGRVVNARISVRCVRRPGGSVDYFLALVEDITERKDAETRLMQRDRQLLESQTVAQIGSWELDVSTHTLVWSAEQYRLLGLEPESVLPTFEFFLGFLFPGDQTIMRDLSRRTLETGEPMSLDHRITRADGSVRWFITRGEGVLDASGKPTRLRGTTQDITKRKDAEVALMESRETTELAYKELKREVEQRAIAEEKFVQTQKMEAIGRLSGGVAHDFNNLLTVILGHVGILEMRELDSEVEESVGEIRHACERAANLTRQLLLFARRETMRMRRVDLNSTLAETIKMLRRILGEDVYIDFRPSPEPLIVLADAGMLDQVLMNLAVNARDAMPQGGRLQIETTITEFSLEAAQQKDHASVGPFATLSVTDSGTGIPADILPKIFEPFFSTKDVGKGTGLGLATVFGIVEHHRGWIDAHSAVGHGTTFRVYLPLVNAEADAIVKAQPENVQGGTETILLVEDEPSIRSTTKRYLKGLGYEVLSAGTGADAMKIFADRKRDISLLLTDIFMPGGMSGVELSGRLIEQKPEIAVIYSSGYSDMLLGGDLSLKEGDNFLAKPFSLASVGQTVQRQLRARGKLAADGYR